MTNAGGFTRGAWPRPRSGRDPRTAMPASRGIVVSYPAAGQSHYETKGVTHA